MADEKTGPKVGNVAMAFLGAVAETPRAMMSPWAAGFEAIWRDISKHAEQPEEKHVFPKKPQSNAKHGYVAKKGGTVKHR